MRNVNLLIILLFINTFVYAIDKDVMSENKLLKIDNKLLKIEKNVLGLKLNFNRQNKDKLNKTILKLENEFNVIQNEFRELKKTDSSKLKKKIKELQSNYEYNILSFTDRFNSSQQSLDYRKDSLTFFFGIFILIASLVLLYYGISVTNIKKSFNEKETEYFKKLKYLKEESEREFNSKIEDWFTTRKIKFEEESTKIIQQSNTKINDKFDTDRNILQEYKEELIEETIKNIKQNYNMTAKKEINLTIDSVDNTIDDDNPWKEK